MSYTLEEIHAKLGQPAAQEFVDQTKAIQRGKTPARPRPVWLRYGCGCRFEVRFASYAMTKTCGTDHFAAANV